CARGGAVQRGRLEAASPAPPLSPPRPSRRGRQPLVSGGRAPARQVSALEQGGRPASPYRLPRGSDDRTLRVEGGIATRLLHVEGSPVLARAWQPAANRVVP